MVGVNTFSGVDYTGSLFVDTQEDEDRDYVGFVFSYQVCNYIIILSFQISFILFLKNNLILLAQRSTLLFRATDVFTP